MTTTNTSLETSGARELSATEIDDVSGGISFIGWIRNVIWQMENTPEGNVITECSPDFSHCSSQPK